MFAAYTPIDKCIGKELKVVAGGQEYFGMLAGVYSTGGVPVLVLTPMNGGGIEQHIPLASAVIIVKN